jgi:uncharacterized protein YtpQ (UPF0354 family)
VQGGTFTSRAIAYLKGSFAVDPSAPQPTTIPLALTGGVAEFSDGTTKQLSADEWFVMRPFVGPLIVTYVVDTGDAYDLLQQRHLTKDGIDRDAVHGIGLNNLARLASERARVRPFKNVFAITMGGDFEASLMLLDPLWDEFFRRFVQGDYAVAAPARDILTFCDAASTAGVAELRELVRRVFPDGDHLLSEHLFVRRDRAWHRLDN